jgi:hypothetical protein
MLWWTNKELEFLKANYGKMPNIEISRALGRPDQAAQHAALRYEIESEPYAGIKLDKVNVNLEKLCVLIGRGKSAVQIGEILGVSKITIRRRAKRLPNLYQDMLRANGARSKSKAITKANLERWHGE